MTDQHESERLDDTEAALPGATPERASTLAVLSMCCSLASVGGCCVVSFFALQGFPETLIALFGLPLLGIAGVTLGWLAFMRVRRAQVPIVGRNAALVGIFLGLISVVVQGSFITGAALPYMSMKRNLEPVVDDWVLSAQKGSPNLASRTLNRETGDAAGVERVRWLLDTMDAEIGGAQDAELSLTIFTRTRKIIAEAREQGHARGNVPPDLPTPRPIEIRGGTGTMVIVVFLDDDALTKDRVEVTDMLFMLDGWRCATILDDGPAKAYADYLGLERIEPRTE